MRQSSWMKADIFRRIPKDLTEATVSGAVISILCVVVMLILFSGEVISYIFPRTQSDMVVDHEKPGDERLKVFLDLDLHAMPCALVSVDVADMLKNHQLDSSEHLKKIRLSATGSEIHTPPANPVDVDATEGCRLQGYILVTKVPGNFHISCHARQDLFMQYFPGGLILDHTIRTLSFEPMSASSVFWYPERGSRPLEGRVDRTGVPTTYQFFLDVVPTIYAGTLTTQRTHQYTFSKKQMPTPRGEMGVIMFSYQLSPIAVQYSSGRVSFTHFLTYVCAIVGGVYTVAGLLSRFVYNSTVEIQKRFLGKRD